MGTPEFSVPALRAVAAACDVVAVVTQPDRPKGRGQQTTESPVATCAHGLGIPVMRPLDMKAPEVRDALAALAAAFVDPRVEAAALDVARAQKLAEATYAYYRNTSDEGDLVAALDTPDQCRFFARLVVHARLRSRLFAHSRERKHPG